MQRGLCFALCSATWAVAQIPSPGWLKLSGEYRARYEGLVHSRFDDSTDHYVFNRVRLEAIAQPATWLSAGAQIQDARIYANELVPDGPPNEDSLDLRLGWVEIRPLPGFRIRAGRQDINYGNQRLIGTAHWGNASRSFDAVRVGYTRKNVALDVFAAAVPPMRHERWNRRAKGDNIHGAGATITSLPRNTSVELLGLWRAGGVNRLDVFTYDVRVLSDLRPAVRLTTELFAQHGNRNSVGMKAWGGNWRVERSIADSWTVRGVYDYGSPDVQILYPTGHDRWGQNDLVGWKNVHHVASELEWRTTKTWRFEGKYHAWWLASASGGLFAANGALVVRDPTGRSGRFVGQELDILAAWTAGKRSSNGIGVGHIFPGTFLERTTPGRGFTMIYAFTMYAF
ncbi:MAG TPA: alginate export family protein [Bryobacteraceae bacterium]|nr:alginate export family protein [Bryobacteraceae bacterium]